jgi:hypothetical protein
MAGLQSIINMAETMEINRRRVMAVQYSRSEVARINETVTRNTWKFNVNVTAMLTYETYRDLLEDIDRLDRRYPEIITFNPATGANSGLSYMFNYQGDMSPSDISNITVTSWSGNHLILTNLPTTSPTTVLFRKGDFIQIADYPYPFTTQYDVLRGSGSTVTVTTHRPNFMGTGVVSRHIRAGNDVQFKMFVNNMPTYRLNPGGSTALINWSGPFQFYEYTGDV